MHQCFWSIICVNKKQEGPLYLRALKDLCHCSWRFVVLNITLRMWIIFMEGKKVKRKMLEAFGSIG